MSREVLQQALEALYSDDLLKISWAKTALMKALAQPVQPEQWTPEDTAHRPGGLAQQEHPEQMARLGWQYVECPACGSEGARAFPKPEEEPVAWFDPVMKDVCRVVNGVDKTSRFTAPLYTSPPKRQPMKRATIADAPDCLNTNDKAMWVLGWNECVEAHGIGDKT